GPGGRGDARGVVRRRRRHRLERPVCRPGRRLPGRRRRRGAGPWRLAHRGGRDGELVQSPTMTTAPDRLSSSELASAIEAVLEPTLGATQVRDLQRLKGGYSREMWSFDALVGASLRPLILCTDTSVGVVGQGPQALDRVREARLLHALHAGGLPVPDTL